MKMPPSAVGNHNELFFTSLWHFIDKTMNCLIDETDQLIYRVNNHQHRTSFYNKQLCIESAGSWAC